MSNSALGGIIPASEVIFLGNAWGIEPYPSVPLPATKFDQSSPSGISEAYFLYHPGLGKLEGLAITLRKGSLKMGLVQCEEWRLNCMSTYIGTWRFFAHTRSSSYRSNLGSLFSETSTHNLRNAVGIELVLILLILCIISFS